MPSKPRYSGQQVMGLLKMLRHSEYKKKMCEKAQNMVNELHVKYTIASELENTQFQLLWKLWWTYCMVCRNDNQED